MILVSSIDAPRRRWRRVALVLSVAVLGAVGWVAAQAWLVVDDLRSARSVASEVAADLQAGETGGLEPLVERLREHAGDAADRTHSPTWRGLSALPVVGDDAEAVARVSSAVDVIAEQSLIPLVETGLDPATFTPRNGRIPLAPIEQLADPLAQAASGFAQAREEMEKVDRSGLVESVRGPYDDALAEVSRGNRAVDAAARGASLLPDMLGARERRTYLVIFQNSAEARSLGGMPGIVTTLTAERGRLSMGKTIAVSSFGALERPILPLTAEERRIWFDQPGTYFQDAVFIPDFPRASELMAARFAEETGREVDGVLSVDPAAMSYVVGATGGLTVDGVALTQDNFVDELVHQPYLRYADDPQAEDAFFAKVAARVFDQALGGGVDPRLLVESLSRGVEEGRVLLHAFRDAEQVDLAATRIAGELPVDRDGPLQVGVYANDSTGSKMSYFLRHETDLEVTSCERGASEVAGRLRVHSDTPQGVASLPMSITGSGDYGVPRGVQLVTFAIIGPTDGDITDIVVDGKPTAEDLATYRGRPVAKVPLWLEPQAQVDVSWRMTAPLGGAEAAELRATPMAHEGGEVRRTTLWCGAE